MGRVIGGQRFVKGTRVVGAEETKRNLEFLQARMASALSEALRREGRRILNAAEPLTPRETGNLRRSAHVTKRRTQQLRPRYWAVMGGSAGSGQYAVGERGTNEQDVRYARLQHEEETFSHPVGDYKFLSRALAKRRSEGMMKEIGQDMADDLRNFVGVRGGRRALSRGV